MDAKREPLVAVRVNPDDRRTLKIEAAKRGSTIQAVIHELCESLQDKAE